MFTHLEDPSPPPAPPELVEPAVNEGRRRLRRRRMVPGGMAMATLLLAGVTVLAMVSEDGDQDFQVGAGTGVPDFRVIDVLEASDEMGTLRSATDRDEFRELWRVVGGTELRQLLPPIRGGEIVVSITIPDDACPPELAGFDRDGDVLTPRFVETAPGCDDPLIPKTYVVALEREPLVPSFVLRLPADPTYGFAEQRLVVMVPPSATDGAEAEVTVPLSEVRWDDVTYPMDCDGFGWNVLEVVLTEPEAGVEVAVVLVACDAGAGTPPRSIFVYERADTATDPDLLQTLWQDGQLTITATVAASGAELVATGDTYSSREVPRCCPDVTSTTTWSWNGDGYEEQSSDAPREP